MGQDPEPEPGAPVKDTPGSGADRQISTPDSGAGDMAEEPVKVLRIGAMILQLLDEVHAGPLDDAARTRLAEIHDRSVKELQDSLAPGPAGELRRLWQPLTGGSPASDEELRIGQAQLAGWIAGLIQNIQSTAATQQAAARKVVESRPGTAFAPGAVIFPGSSLRAGSIPPRARRPGSHNTGTGTGAEDTPPGQYL